MDAGAGARMRELGVDVLLLSTGADLPYLTGYEAMPLERLTMLVLPVDGDAVLVVPRLEAPRVVEQPDAFEVLPWDETDDPIEVVAGLVQGIDADVTSAAIGDHTWARFVLDLQAALPDVAFRRAVDVTGPLRVVKDAAEIDALRAAARVVDDVAAVMRDRPVRRPHRARRAPRARRAHARGRPRARQLRHRRRRRRTPPARTTTRATA